MNENFLAEQARAGFVPAEPIKVSCDIAASASDVWAAITESGNLTSVHPFCERNPVEVWPGPDSRDDVHYYSGLHYRRDTLAWNEGVGYELAVGPPDQKIASAVWVIEPVAADRSTFSIEVSSFVRSDLPAATREAYTENVIKGSVPPYLNGVVRGVGHYVETGTPVRRNQFGAVPIFSPDTEQV